MCQLRCHCRGFAAGLGWLALLLRLCWGKEWRRFGGRPLRRLARLLHEAGVQPLHPGVAPEQARQGDASCSDEADHTRRPALPGW
jgi:hypothetical protein